MTGNNEVVIARYEGEWHAHVLQKVRNFWLVSSTNIDVEKHSIEVSLHKLLSRYSHGVGDPGNPVTDLSEHFLDQQGNQKLVFNDKDARGALSGGWLGARVGHKIRD